MPSMKSSYKMKQTKALRDIAKAKQELEQKIKDAESLLQ